MENVFFWWMGEGQKKFRQLVVKMKEKKEEANIQISHDQSKELKTMPQKLRSDSQPKSDF